MIYQLKYTSKDEAIQDLKDKNVCDTKGNWSNPPTHNVVFVGKIPDQKATYDHEGNELTPPTFKDGYHVDVMDNRDDLDFGEQRTFPDTPYHSFKSQEYPSK